MRRPLFLAGLSLLALAFLVEVGGGFLVTPGEPDEATLLELMPEDLDEDERREALNAAQSLADDSPPGFAIRALALVDALLLLTLGLLVLAMFISHELQGRLVGITTLVGGLVVAVLSLVMLFAALVAVTRMVGLLLSTPFGTITYVAVYGSFDRTTAATLLGVVLLAKIGFVLLAVAAYPRIVREKGLVALTLTSIFLVLLVSFLHGLVPRMLVSILDAVGAIVVAIVAIVWAVVLMAGSLVSVVRALRVRRS